MDDGNLTPSTPVTPPTTEDDELLWLRLIRSRRVGPATFWRLIGEHGSAAAALAALPGIARAAGVENYSACPDGVALAEMKAGRRAGARLICHASPDYPARLRDISDAPPILWTIGDPALAARPMVAIVGARNASSLGLRMARRLAAGLAEAGFAVVSGLARGIDAAAHEAALSPRAGAPPGATIAVQAGGVDMVYPQENAALFDRIAREGLRLSEQPMGQEPLARHFPLRNRLISGLSEAVVVVEAAPGSGSLITAREALDQGRDVLAVPGHPVDARAAGCNALIRDGAVLVRNVEDVIEALAARGITAQPQLPAPPMEPRSAPAAAILSRMRRPDAATTGRRWPPPRRADETAGPRATREAAPAQARAHPAETAQIHQLILDRLGPSPLAEDQLIRDLALPAAQVAPELLALELDGLVLRAPGGLLSRPG